MTARPAFAHQIGKNANRGLVLAVRHQREAIGGTGRWNGSDSASNAERLSEIAEIAFGHGDRVRGAVRDVPNPHTVPPTESTASSLTTREVLDSITVFFFVAKVELIAGAKDITRVRLPVDLRCPMTGTQRRRPQISTTRF